MTGSKTNVNDQAKSNENDERKTLTIVSNSRRRESRMLLTVGRTVSRVVRVVRGSRGRRSRRGTVGKEAANIVPGDDLHESARFDVTNFDESGFESENVRIVKR
jgi:hypothetical protein